MALKSSLLWFRLNWRNTSSRFFTSCGPWTIRADCCGETSQSLSARSCTRPQCSHRPAEAHPQALAGRPTAQQPPATAAKPSCSGMQAGQGVFAAQHLSPAECDTCPPAQAAHAVEHLYWVRASALACGVGVSQLTLLLMSSTDGSFRFNTVNVGCSSFSYALWVGLRRNASTSTSPGSCFKSYIYIPCTPGFSFMWHCKQLAPNLPPASLYPALVCP